LAAPIAGYYLGNPGWALAFGAMAVLLWERHAENIQRLAAGHETKIGAK
jgi:glycerol-3-phosphate acyltransferase PlsY